MFCERDDLRRALSSRKITVRLKSYVDIVRHPLRDLAQACGYPVARFFALRAALDLVRKNANQRRTEFRSQLRMRERDVHVLGSLTRLRRMKDARSVNATDLEILKLASSKFCTTE